MQPTKEQADAVALFNTKANLAIVAGAGTGKTTTLRQIGEATDRHGAYVAFNKAIVEDAKKRMPRNVAVSTVHSLAYRQYGSKFRHRLNSGRVRSDDIARQLGVDPFMVPYGAQRKVLQPGYLAGLAMRAITRFCQSADDVPAAHHVPYIEGIDPPDDAGNRTYSNNDKVREMLAPLLGAAWADFCDYDGRLPYKHDHYVKYWQQRDPVIPGEFVLFDEAQDAAPVMLAAVEAQADSQLIFVGDDQQQIYEWRGAVNALDKVPAEARTYLTQSFRFGPAIAAVANKLLDVLDARIRLTGLPSIDSKLAPLPQPDAVLTRSNACAVSTVLDFQRRGVTVHLVGGGTEVVSFAKAAEKLMDRQPCYHPDLSCFTSWGEVQEYVQQDPQGDELALMVRLIDEYGVPTILQALDRMPPSDKVQVVVSTAHKAKGLEWDRVKLAADFQNPGPDSLGEWRLLYVASTRAKLILDVDACEPVARLMGRAPMQQRAVTTT